MNDSTSNNCSYLSRYIMRIVLFFPALLFSTICFGQSYYFKLPDDKIYNEKEFNLHFKAMIKALPADYSLTPVIYHKYKINDSIFNYVTFEKIWWGDKKINPANFDTIYKQDPLFLNLFKKLPEFTLTDLEGKTFNSSRLTGKPSLITFWSKGCSGCILEFPQLDKLREKWGNKVNFIAIGFDTRDVIIDFLEKTPFGFYHLANGSNYAHNALKISSIPRNIFLDKDGYIREIKSILQNVVWDQVSGTPRIKDNSEFDKLLEKMTKL
jgi:cytochrome c biogenesis protein CcmG, thiol:disulfide interchange protein DsbE